MVDMLAKVVSEMVVKLGTLDSCWRHSERKAITTSKSRMIPVALTPVMLVLLHIFVLVKRRDGGRGG